MLNFSLRHSATNDFFVLFLAAVNYLIFVSSKCPGIYMYFSICNYSGISSRDTN